MKTFDQCLKIVRNDDAVNTVWFGFDRGNEYGFMVSPQRKIIPGDTSSCLAFVDKGDGNIRFEPISILYDASAELKQAMVNKIFVDATEAQLSKL